jgi:hypothetical protein
MMVITPRLIKEYIVFTLQDTINSNNINNDAENAIIRTIKLIKSIYYTCILNLLKIT